MGLPIGIDLGTTYSAIAKWLSSGLNIGPDTYHCQQENQYFMASKIFIPDFNQKENFVVGANAIRHGVADPDKFYSAFKRGMDDNAPIVRSEGQITPVELSSMLLSYMLDRIAAPVEGVNDFIPEGVVVSVPYYFTEPPCQNTRAALTNVLDTLYSDNADYHSSINLRTVAEPIAAGLDYAFTNAYRINGKENILIFDLGGGTFDVTIYELENSNSTLKLKFTVLATDGDARLGGEDFDASIRKFILDRNGIDENLANDPRHKRCLALLYKDVTETKCILSSCEKQDIVIQRFFGNDDIEFPLTVGNIEEIMRGKKGYNIDYISKIDDIVDRCITNSKLHANQIDRIVLVGGSSKMPCIRKLLEDKFGNNKLYESPRPSETVARGASIWAAYLLDKKNKDTPNYKRHLDKWDEIVVKEKTAHSLGILTANGRVAIIIDSNMFTPVKGTRSYIPAHLSEDGMKAELDPLIIHQGRDIIGTIPIPTIYAHGRAKKDINIAITLIAEATSVKVEISVPRGNEDTTDIMVEGEIQIA